MWKKRIRVLLSFWRNSTCIVPVLLPLGGAWFIFQAFYPGYLSADSLWQLKEAREGFIYDDWHPPLMSAFWRVIEKIISGPQGMVFFHNLMFWCAVFLFSLLTTRRKVASLFWLLIGLLPPQVIYLGTVWKDVGMACALFLGIALLTWAERKGSVFALCFAWLPFFYATCVRHNALLALFPLCVWAILIARDLFSQRLCAFATPIRTTGMACLLVILLFMQANKLNRFLTEGRLSYPLQQILIHDLVAISVSEKVNLLPSYLNEQRKYSVLELDSLFREGEVVHLFAGNNQVPGIPRTKKHNEFEQLKSHWISVVPYHIKPYLIHRVRSFQSLIAMKSDTVCGPYISNTGPNEFGIFTRPSSLNRAMVSFVGYFKNTILFRGWFYLLAIPSLVLFGFLLRKGQLRSMVAIAASGYFYLMGYFFVATTCEFRMIWWTSLSAFLVLFLTLFPFIDRERKRFF